MGCIPPMYRSTALRGMESSGNKRFFFFFFFKQAPVQASTRNEELVKGWSEAMLL